ncbi:MAG: class I SAM-dependent methyltransferase [Halioglobus sp.]|nr:class I SAM-dependent methyltransferase [Halioglobus sp.]
MSGETHCPLCAGGEISWYSSDRRRRYLQCGDCELVFVPPAYHLDRAAEKAEYALHENHIHDPGYRRFLSRLMEPLVTRLAAGARGLDFGCGPGPALAHMLREEGFEVVCYDSLFVPDAAALAQCYDFICATEVVEHLHHPGRELERLWSLLQPGGWLGIMTKLVRDAEAFSRWHYKNDPTHVCFFSARTWHWWARRYGAAVEIIGADVILLRRPLPPSP